MKYQAVVFAMLAGCSGKVTLYSCSVGGGGKAVVDRAKLTGLVEQLAREHATPAHAVRCPDELAWNEGGTFECEVDLTGGTFAVVITMNGELINANWKEQMEGGASLEGKILLGLDSAAVEAIDCGDQLLFARAGDSVTCPVTRGSAGTVTATIAANGMTIMSTFEPAAAPIP